MALAWDIIVSRCHGGLKSFQFMSSHFVLPPQLSRNLASHYLALVQPI
jgi:hypothetical protein